MKYLRKIRNKTNYDNKKIKAIGVKIGGQMTDQYLKSEKTTKGENNKSCDC